MGSPAVEIVLLPCDDAEACRRETLELIAESIVERVLERTRRAAELRTEALRKGEVGGSCDRPEVES